MYSVGTTLLAVAAFQGKAEAVGFLLDHCSYASDVGDSCGVTPLMDALRAGFVHVARLLISRHTVRKSLCYEEP